MPASSASGHDLLMEDDSLHLVTSTLPSSQPHDTNVFFTFNDWSLSDEAKDIIKVSVEERPEDWAGTFRIDGHTDIQGTDTYNRVLGLKRAESVKAYLVSLGTPEDTIQVQSFGKDGAVCQEQTADCFEHNRRAHVAFLSQLTVQQDDTLLSTIPDSSSASASEESAPVMDQQHVEDADDEMLVQEEIPGELVRIDPFASVESLP
jgi:hypothetical protein